MSSQDFLRQLLFEPYGEEAPLFPSGIALAQAITGEPAAAARTRTTASALSQALTGRRGLGRKLADGIRGAARRRLQGQEPASRRDERLHQLDWVIDQLSARGMPLVPAQAALANYRRALRTARVFFFFSPPLLPWHWDGPGELLATALVRRWQLVPGEPAGSDATAPPPRVTLCVPTALEARKALRMIYLSLTGRRGAAPDLEALSDRDAVAAIENLEETGSLRVLVVPSPTPSATTLLFDPFDADRAGFHLYYLRNDRFGLVEVPPDTVGTWAETSVWEIEQGNVAATPVRYSVIAEAMRDAYG